MMRSFSTFLFLTFLLTFSFANLVYVDNFGVKPIPQAWTEITENFSKGVSFTLSPAVYFSSWPSNFVTKYSGWWGVPVNPAQGTFYLQDELPELFSLSLNYTNNGFCLFVSLPLEKEYQNKLKTLSFGHNIPLDFSIDLNFPKEAYVYFANDVFFASIGRFKIAWGDAKYPVHISPTTSLDNLTVMVRFSNVIYTFHAINSYPLLAPSEYEIQKNYSDQHTAGRYFYEPSKFIFAHRLDFYRNLGQDFKLRIGMSELNVVGGKFPDLIDLSPVLIYHNTYGEGYSNVTGGIDFSLEYNQKVKIYGELVLDDIVGPTEVGYGYKPGAQAYDFGVTLKLGNTNLWFEYSETSEWMYVTNYLPYLRINVRKFYIQNVPGGRFMPDYPLGFIYGPDAKMFSGGIETRLDAFKLSVVYNYLIKGLVNDNGNIRWKWFWDSWPGNVTESGAKTPEKVGEAYYHIVSARVDWGNFSIVYKTVNLENHHFSATLSVTW